jgi:PadR family transcriptional regulator, regulatory protein PadR
MSKGQNLDDFEILTLAALVRLGPDAYGASVRREIEGRAGRDVAIGALYATLDRLEEKGLVVSRIGEATAERGGRAKRHVEITTLGRARLEKSASMLGEMLGGLFPRVRKR